MSFAAVISAHLLASDDSRTLRACLHFAGQTLVEYQVRQAAEAGAGHVVVLVGAVTPELSRAVDRLMADGISVALARDLVALGREVPRDHDVLLIADGAIVAQQYYDQLAHAPGNAVLVMVDGPEAGVFERIDGIHRWAGLARLGVSQLYDTLDMLGDWDLQSTLLRQAVQSGASRIAVPQEAIVEGRVALVESQQGADILSRALMPVRSGADAPNGAAEHYVFDPLARLIVPVLLRHQVPSDQVRIGGIVLALIGIVTTQLSVAGAALLLFLAATLASEVADSLARLGRRGGQGGWRAYAVPVLNLLGIMLVGGAARKIAVNGSMGGVYLALLLAIVQGAIIQRRLGNVPHWSVLSIGTAMLILFATQIVGMVHFGMALTTLLATATLAMCIFQKKAS